MIKKEKIINFWDSKLILKVWFDPHPTPPQKKIDWIKLGLYLDLHCIVPCLTCAISQLIVLVLQSFLSTGLSPEAQNCFVLKYFHRFLFFQGFLNEILTAKLQFAYQLIASYSVKIHNRNIQGAVSYLLPGDFKFKSLKLR